MRRSDLIAAVENIASALGAAGLDDPRHVREDLSSFVRSLHKYIRLAEQFGPVERAILKVWGLDSIDSAEFLAELVAPGKKEERPHTFSTMVWNVHAFKNFLLPTARLLAQDEPLDSGKASLTIILPAEGGARSKPARYASALEAVQGLYSFCARIHGEDPDALSVASFDSGSDMSFVLVGAAIVIGAIDRLLTNIYRTWAFHKQATEGANTENVLDKLAVYEEIHRLEKEKKIGREEAGHLRHQLKTAASSIVEAGVVTPDILKESHGDARQLMAPAPKLLLGPPAGAAQPVAPEEEALTPGISSLTPDERRLLENLLTKIKSHPGGTPDTVDPTAPFEPTDDGPRDTRRPDESEMSGGEGPSGAE